MIKYTKLDLVILLTQDSEANLKRMGFSFNKGFNSRGFKVLIILESFLQIYSIDTSSVKNKKRPT